MEGCLHVNGLFSGGYGSFFYLREKWKAKPVWIEMISLGVSSCAITPYVQRHLVLAGFESEIKATSATMLSARIKRSLSCESRTFSRSLLWVPRALMLASESPHSQLLCLESTSTLLFCSPLLLLGRVKMSPRTGPTVYCWIVVSYKHFGEPVLIKKD